MCLLTIGCKQDNKGGLIMQNMDKPDLRSIEIFKDTPAWELARAVHKENLSKIEEIIRQDSTLVDYQDPYYGMTLLMRAINTEKYQSAKKLLELGANPNIMSKTGLTALFEAISYSWYDNNANPDPKFVKLMLEYGANPNTVCHEGTMKSIKGTVEEWASPLMHSIFNKFEKTKLLVEYGADIRYKTDLGETATSRALLMSDVDAAYLLIVEKKAKVTDPFYFYSLRLDSIKWNEPHYPVDLLLDWYYEIGSEQYRKKMAIVEEFKRQGVDYAERKKYISKAMMRKITVNHPDDWQKFIEQY